MDYVLSSVKHYRHRDQYRFSIHRFEEDVSRLKKRLQATKVGFWAAVLCSLFLVLLPFTGPLAYSVWRKKREIEKQVRISVNHRQVEETKLRRALETEDLSKEVIGYVGDMSMDALRTLLDRVLFLKQHFGGQLSSPSVGIQLVRFVHLYRSRLVDVFGPCPEKMCDVLKWFGMHMDFVREKENELRILEENMQACCVERDSMLKGYSIVQLDESMEALEQTILGLLPLPIASDFKHDFAELAITLPPLLCSVRRVLHLASHNQYVAEKTWSDHGVYLSCAYNMLKLFLLDTCYSSARKHICL